MTTDLPQFTEVDLAKTTKHGSDEVYPGPVYLALVNGRYDIGRFNPVWYGLTSDGSFGNRQYDPPGTNASRWQRLWRFDNAEDLKNQYMLWEQLTNR